MNKRSLRILEFNKILAMLEEYATSPMAKKRCNRIKPQRDINMISNLQEETRDALLRLYRQGNLSFTGLYDLGAAIKRLEVQGILTSRELLDIAALLTVAKNTKQYGDFVGEDNEATFDCLTTKFNMLEPLEYLSTEIKRCIISEGEFADDASSTLKDIRRQIKLTNDKLHSQLAKMIKGDEHKSMLQDSIITMRNGRYCIPVKQEYRSKVPGMIHDQSSSGSTIFIEPMAIVNLNNEIKELSTTEAIEIEKILEALSIQAAQAVEDIKFDMDTLTDLDFIFARAKLAREQKASQPVFNTDGIINIIQGRHPLLDKHSVVPIDIRLGDDYNLLIITGPNTGGKTVSLKTLGLFTLMGQAGLHIPALDGSKLGIFQDVFADIGDEQSIEQSLSTFSSHMSNIVYIINHATPDTLCLFDELGGGTDPTEGAALAISILNHLKEMGARCMATTHYSELKTYALSTSGVENASCEFDVASLRPTYKLMLGIPGKSNAFAISKKLGLADFIIDNAKLQIDTSSIDMETIIADLEKSKLQIDTDKETITKSKLEIESLKRSLLQKEESIAAKRNDILEKARNQARELVEEAKSVADETIRNFNKWQSNPSKASMRDMESKRSKLRDKMKGYENSKTPKQELKSNHKAKDFHIGDMVQVISMGTSGTISTLPDSKGFVTVQMGILSSKLHLSDLIIQAESTFTTDSKSFKPSKGKISINKSYSFSPEINLLGKTVDEAISALDKYLDDACLAHMSQVRIVHGKGTGSLRNGIHQYLKKQSYVRSFRLGEFGEGDAGVTIVEL